MMTPALRWLFLTLVLLVGAAASGDADAAKASGKKLDIALFEYSSNLRWNEFETAWTYVDPIYRAENPLGDLQRERFKIYRVSGYEVKSRENLGKEAYAQVVEIRVIHKYTEVERVITVLERWRWDAASKRWWLSSGLPKFNQD